MKVVIDGVLYVPSRVLPSDASVYEQALSAPMTYCVDFEDITVRDYLCKLLSGLLAQGWNFNAKRPFGNGCWYLNLIYSLIDCGYIPGDVVCDEDGIKSRYHSDEADFLIAELIQYAFYRQGKEAIA